jgi:uncharacterized repeat protein (TIGR01451 family)
MTYTEDITPTLAWGVSENLVGDRLGPYPLDYPFSNWSDAVVPTPGTAVPFRDQERHPIALARQEADYRTVFFSFPFETLPEAGRAGVMERVVGWLSWLGGSTFAADRGAVAPGDTLTYTLEVQNDGLSAVTASLSNTLPADIIMVDGSVTGPGSYDPSTRRLSWGGLLDPGEDVTFTYRAVVVTGTAVSSPLVNTARLGLEDRHVHFRRAAVVRVNAPDLSASDFQCGPSPARPGSRVTCTLALANAGPGDAPEAMVANPLPVDTTLVPGSLTWTGGGAAEVLGGAVRWTGSVGSGAYVTLTYRLTLPVHPMHPPLYNVAFLADGVGGAWERAAGGLR